MHAFRHHVDQTLALALVERHHADVLTCLWRRNSQRLRRWEPWAAKDADFAGAPAWIDYCLRRFSEGTYLYLLILIDGKPAGTCGLALDPANRSASIGYFIDHAFEGRGYVTRAADWLTDQAFRRGIHRAEIGAAVGNTRSRAVAERLGYRLDGVIRAGLVFPDRFEDRAVYGLLHDDHPMRVRRLANRGNQPLV